MNGIQILVFFAINMLSACGVNPSVTPTDFSIAQNEVPEELIITAQINDERELNEPDRILDFAVSPNGEIIAIYENTGVFLYTLATMAKTQFVAFETSDYSRLRSGAVAFSHDGRLIAISGKFSNQEISIWNIDDREVVSSIKNLPRDHFITEIEFSPDDSSIMIRNTYTEAIQCQGYVEDRLTLIDLSNESIIFDIDKCSIYPPIQFQFVKDSRIFFYLGSMSEKHEVYFVDSNNGKIISKEVRDWNLDGNLYGTSPDGDILLVQKFENNKYLTYLIDSLSNEIIQTIEGKIALYIEHNRYVVNNFGAGPWDYRVDGVSKCLYNSINLSPEVKMSANGKVFASINSPDEVQIWDISSCELINAISVP